jgi:hypothetical protein
MATAATQYVCLVCGYNMIGECPDACPFCGARRAQIITQEECAQQFRVHATPVTGRVIHLGSLPALGYEHASYLVKTPNRRFWIDCPCAFDETLDSVDVITFTHKDFMGASNLYRDRFGAQVWINELDAVHPLARPFPVDRNFSGYFSEDGLEAHHVGGHSPGFTVYMVDSVLFVCDLLYFRNNHLIFNPHGPKHATREASTTLVKLLRAEGRAFSHVCDVNGATPYGEWEAAFTYLLGKT